MFIDLLPSIQIESSIKLFSHLITNSSCTGAAIPMGGSKSYSCLLLLFSHFELDNFF